MFVVWKFFFSSTENFINLQSLRCVISRLTNRKKKNVHFGFSWFDAFVGARKPSGKIALSGPARCILRIRHPPRCAFYEFSFSARSHFSHAVNICRIDNAQTTTTNQRTQWQIRSARSKWSPKWDSRGNEGKSSFRNIVRSKIKVYQLVKLSRVGRAEHGISTESSMQFCSSPAWNPPQVCLEVCMTIRSRPAQFHLKVLLEFSRKISQNQPKSSVKPRLSQSSKLDWLQPEVHTRPAWNPPQVQLSSSVELCSPSALPRN